MNDNIEQLFKNVNGLIECHCGKLFKSSHGLRLHYKLSLCSRADAQNAEAQTQLSIETHAKDVVSDSCSKDDSETAPDDNDDDEAQVSVKIYDKSPPEFLLQTPSLSLFGLGWNKLLQEVICMSCGVIIPRNGLENNREKFFAHVKRHLREKHRLSLPGFEETKLAILHLLESSEELEHSYEPQRIPRFALEGLQIQSGFQCSICLFCCHSHHYLKKHYHLEHQCLPTPFPPGIILIQTLQRGPNRKFFNVRIHPHVLQQNMVDDGPNTLLESYHSYIERQVNSTVPISQRHRSAFHQTSGWDEIVVRVGAEVSFDVSHILNEAFESVKKVCVNYLESVGKELPLSSVLVRVLLNSPTK
jgi:hypothetical protein